MMSSIDVTFPWFNVCFLCPQDDENKPVVQKCCAIGQNISFAGDGRRVCAPSMLTFQPIFYQANDSHIWGSDSHMWRYDSNDVQTIVGFPACSYDRSM